MRTPSILTLIAMSCTPFIAAANVEEPDTLAYTQLEEIVVQGDAQYTSATKTTYLPKTHVKEAAQDAVDLLRRMAIPQLKVSPTDSKVSTTSGQEVTIFINYVKASAEDIQGMKTTDVRRVEYLDYPSDPRFRGVAHAVNYIMHEYDWGGYTKISDRQYVSDGISNQGAVFSKFTYRKMVYDLYLSTDYVNNHNVGSSSTYATYRLPAGDVQRNDVWQDAHLRYMNVPVTFRASYNTPTMQIINTAGFSFMNRMISELDSRLTFSNDNQDYDQHRSTPYITRAAQWNGNYYFMLPRSFNIGVYPQFSYSHNSSWSDYSTTIPGQSPIINNAREDAFFGRLDLNIGKQVGKHNFRLDINGLIRTNNVDYSGSTSYKSDFKNKFLCVGLAYSLNSNRISIKADAGAAYEHQNTNETKLIDWYPYLHLSTTWTPNKYNQFGLWAQYATNSPGQSVRTPNVLQVNELTYMTGNPLLENARHITLSANYTFLPTDMFNLNAYYYYFSIFDRAVTVYEPYNSGTALLQTYRNDGDYTMMQAGLNGTLRLLDNKLIIQAGPTFKHYNSTGYIDTQHNAFSCDVYAQYYLGHFNFSAYYNTRDHSMDNSSGAYYTTRSRYGLQAGWSNKDWSISLLLSNFARYKESSYWYEFDTPYYHERTLGYDGNYNASVGLTVTYTIGYGKKIERGNELQGIQGAGSAIMN